MLITSCIIKGFSYSLFLSLLTYLLLKNNSDICTKSKQNKRANTNSGLRHSATRKRKQKEKVTTFAIK